MPLVPRRLSGESPRFMAFWNPVAFVCHPHRSVLLFRNWTSRTEVVVQAVGRVFASARSDPPSKPDGPVRYVQKPLPPETGDGSRRDALETRRTQDWGSIQPDSTNEGQNDAESKIYKKRGYTKPSKGRGNTSLSGPRLGTAVLPVEGKSTRRPDLRIEDEVEKDGQNTFTPELDAGQSLFDDTRLLKTHLDDSQGDEPRRQVTDKDSEITARNYALALLARGPQTESNLRSKMSKKNVPPEVIDRTISDLQKWGVQSDEEYAEIFARSRWTDNTWGPKRIKYELLRKGIRRETVEAALVKLFQTSETVRDGEEEDLGKWGMTTEAAEHLIAQARRRWSQGNVKVEVKKRRMIGWLQRRGFPWTIIPDVLKVIESGKAND